VPARRRRHSLLPLLGGAARPYRQRTCRQPRRRRRPRGHAHHREATPTAVTSLSPSAARRKESAETTAAAAGAKTGLLRSLLPTGSNPGSDGGEGGGAAVTWYGSRDVEVGRPTNVRYVSLRRLAQQSSSVESDAGAVTPTSATKRLAPKRFGFVGWTRTAAVQPPGESLVRHQSSGDSSVGAAASWSFGEDGPGRLPVIGTGNARYSLYVYGEPVVGNYNQFFR